MARRLLADQHPISWTLRIPVSMIAGPAVRFDPQRGKPVPRNARWGRRLIAATLVVLMGTVLAGPAAAGEPAVRALPTGAQPLRAAVATHLSHLVPDAKAFAPQTSGGATGTENRPFLRTPAGVAAVVLMAAGAGYAVYSTSHDRKPVKSPIR
jgi:hypothetical protein